MIEELADYCRVREGKKVSLKDYDPGLIPNTLSASPDAASLRENSDEILAKNREMLERTQEILWASNTYAMLIILQGMDTAGKDSTIKHVMSGMNPQGCRVYSFKTPTEQELDHTFLWRYVQALPERGMITVFNRSYYEELLVVKVHPELLDRERIPRYGTERSPWGSRYEDINGFERHLVRNGTIVLKFFLHISKEEQKHRILDRLNNPEKCWKFSPDDIAEREYWEDYIRASEKMLAHTSTELAPWYVVPSDHKWVAHAVIAEIITHSIESLHLSYPPCDESKLREIREAKERLDKEP